MGKRQLVVIGIIVACILGSGLYVYFNNSKHTESQQPKPQTASSSDSPKQEIATTPKETARSTNAPGKYTDYSKEAVAKAKGTKILFFYAPWCPQCRAADRSIKNNNLPDNLTIFKTDYDSNQALRKRYGVTIQTTFVKIDNSGNKIKSFVAYDEPTFESVKKELL